MIFLALLACTLIFLFNRPKQNILLDPMTLFFIGLLYYGFFIPVTMELFGEYQLPFLNSPLNVTEKDLTIISFVLTLGYGAFVLGYRIFTPKYIVDKSYFMARRADFFINDGGGIILATVLFASMATCIVFFRPELFGLFSGYDGKIITRYEASTFSLIYNLALIVATVLMVRIVLFGRRYIVMTAAFVSFQVLWAILTFSKEPMVFGAIVLFAAAARFAPKRQLAIFGTAVVAGIAILIFFIPAFAQYRFSGQLAFVNPANVALPYLFSDAAGPFSTLVLGVRAADRIELAALWQSFVLWIPRGIWPDRPLDSAEQFAQAVMPGWQPGYGLGFSPFAEAQIRFGVVLSPILLFLAGLSLSGLQRLAIRIVPRTLSPALLLVVQGYMLFVTHRGAFSAIFTAMAQFWIPFLVGTMLIRYGQSRAGFRAKGRNGSSTAGTPSRQL
jgi:hypothetical protein